MQLTKVIEGSKGKAKDVNNNEIIKSM
jgi:hypothetical protein